MTRYKKLFQNLTIRKEAAFIPFVVLGDPTIEISLRIIDILIKNGANALELGIPFSDPIADGIVIQNSNLRAFKNGITVLKCFNMLKNIREKYDQIPIGLLLYSNLVFRNGIKNFYSKCKELEIDSILLADVPIEEYKIFLIESNKNQISPIFICPPDANPELIENISNNGKSYIYLLSRSGITGMKENTNISLNLLIKNFKKITSLPLIQGFGIYHSKQIKNIISSGISGVICGSVIIKIIEKYHSKEKILLNKLRSKIFELKNATKITTNEFN